jgi:hypothetical protein
MHRECSGIEKHDSALICWFRGEEGSNKVKRVLACITEAPPPLQKGFRCYYIIEDYNL